MKKDNFSKRYKIDDSGFFDTKTFYDEERSIYETQVTKEHLDQFYSSNYYDKFYVARTPSVFIKKLLIKLAGDPPHIKNSSDFSLFKKYVKNWNSFLEVGSGDGEMMKIVPRFFSDVYALEMDNDQNSLLKTKYKNINVLADDFDDLVLSKFVDVVYMRHMLEHVLDLDQTVAKIHEILSTNGLAVINVPNCENKDILNLSLYEHPHTYHFTKKGLGGVFTEHGFDIEYLDYVTWKPMNKITRFIYRIMKKNCLIDGDPSSAEMLFLVARKVND